MLVNFRFYVSVSLPRGFLKGRLTAMLYKSIFYSNYKYTDRLIGGFHLELLNVMTISNKGSFRSKGSAYA